MLNFGIVAFVFAWQCAYIECENVFVHDSTGSEALVHYFTETWYNKSLAKLMDALNTPQISDRYFEGNEKVFKNIREPVLGFSWSTCGTSADPVQIKALSLSPDPLRLPGNVTLSFDISTSVNLTSPLQIVLTIKKKVVFVWVEVPCIDREGSCTYSDICTILPAQCPPEFIKYNIPCHCPAAQGEYNFPEGQIQLPSLPLPSWATHGDYKINAVASLQGKQLFCIDLVLSLG